MSMYFSHLLAMLLVTTPSVVVFSVCICVGCCVCPISPRAWRDGMDSLQLMKSSHSSASAADDMTALMILAIVNTAPLLGGNAVFFTWINAPLLCFWVLFQRGTRRLCGPLGPCHLHVMWVWHQGGWTHSLKISSLFASCAPLGWFMCCDGSNFCQHSRIYCPCIIQKSPRDFLSKFLLAILRGGYTSADSAYWAFAP